MTLNHKTLIGALTAALVVLCSGIIIIAGRNASPEFLVVSTSLITLCGLIVYDIISRRIWENNVSAEMQKLSDYHDRLVREVARNRSDIAILKEGLGETATIVEKQNRQNSYGGSAEARMIESIARQLGQLGQEPRALIGTAFDRDVMELEYAPPPAKKPLPASAIDEAVNGNPNNLSDAVVLECIRNAVREDKIDVFEQPVVKLPQRKTLMKEIYARIKAGPGTYLPAQRYMALAKKENAVPAIDNLLLLRCLQILRTQKNEVPFILNITTQTLNDKGFMNDLLGFLAENRKMAGQIIFELPQSDIESMQSTMVPIIDGLSQLGCRFSMDRVASRTIDIGLLKKMHIRFIKIDASWLLKEGATKEGFSRVLRLKKQLDRAGIDMIIEKIETEASIRELLDFTVDFGQGYLFGKPDISLSNQNDKHAA